MLVSSLVGFGSLLVVSALGSFTALFVVFVFFPVSFTALFVMSVVG
ncbi:MAG: hypothetical protein ABEH66_03590 [Halobacteriales archaeon]